MNHFCGVERSNTFATRLFVAAEPVIEKTMDEVLNMDNVTDMDTLQETA